MKQHTQQVNKEIDLPLEVQEVAQEETEQTEHIYNPVVEGEEWIARGAATIRVRQFVALSTRSAEVVEQERTTRNKAKFLEVFRTNLGNIGMTCEKIGIGRTQYYEWKKTDAQFKSAIAKIEDERIEMVEDELFALINKHDGPSIRFFMERINPKYKAKSQTEIVTGDKTFEELIYSVAAKKKALAESNNNDGKPAQ